MQRLLRCVVRNQAVQVGKNESFPWQVAKTTGNHFFWLSGRRVLTVFTKFGKWNYGVQLEGNRSKFENGFLTEADAMKHAEETYGDQVAQPEVSTTSRPTPALKVVPKREIEIEPEVGIEPHREEERQVVVEEEKPEPLSARSPHEYVKAYCEGGSTPWEKVLYHSSGETKSISVVAKRARLSIEETLNLLETAYDPEIVEITLKNNFVQVRLGDRCCRKQA